MFPEHLNDITTYNNEMCKSLEDKLWFLKEVPYIPDVIVDYGCADGQILKRIRQLHPSVYLIGFDISQEQINLARENFKNETNCSFTSSWLDVLYQIKRFKTKLLIANSVTHEVYYYFTQPNYITKYWLNIFCSNFDYIAIRDMALEHDHFSGFSDENQRHEALRRIINSPHGNRYYQISRNKCTIRDDDIIEFLMKYRYIENWDRERRENYFPLTTEEFIDIVPKTYKLVKFDHYALPFNVERVKADFGIDISKFKTHIKMLITKNADVV